VYALRSQYFAFGVFAYFVFPHCPFGSESRTPVELVHSGPIGRGEFEEMMVSNHYSLESPALSLKLDFVNQLGLIISYSDEKYSAQCLNRN
jgi:hypothetical protein